jgi:hypothetical protein
MFRQTRERPTAGRLKSSTLCRVGKFAIVARPESAAVRSRLTAANVMGARGAFRGETERAGKDPRPTDWQSFALR